MADSDSSSSSEWTHDSVPGYRRAFFLALAIMALYLAIAFVSSPGKVKGHYDKEGKKGDQAAESPHASDETGSETL